MIKEDAINFVYGNVEGDVKSVIEMVDEIYDYPEPLTQEELIGELCVMFDNGLGEKDIKNLVGEIATDQPLLAKTIFEELTYWINHDEKTRRKV